MFCLNLLLCVCLVYFSHEFFSPYTPGRGVRWHVLRYSATKKDNIETSQTSPCFSVGGYLFRLSLKHYRNEQGVSFLSVYINNGPGPHDDNLIWPFPTARLDFYLYNQLSDRNHLNFSLDAPTNEWKSKPTAWRGWGRPSAWRHQEIENVGYARYIEADTIVIGFNVTFTKSWLI